MTGYSKFFTNLPAKRFTTSAALLLFSVFLVGCNGSDSDSENDEPIVNTAPPNDPVDTSDSSPPEDIPQDDNDESESEESGNNDPEDDTSNSDGSQGSEEPEDSSPEAAESDEGSESSEETENQETWYKPQPLATWQWQLSGNVNTDYGVEIYDIDLFDSPIALIEELHSKGIKVICYFSGGSYEEWRDDAPQFAPSDLGNNLDDWPGERWLDIRSENVRNIMKARLDIAAEKGCDGVEPDNMDGYTNNPGVPINGQDQLNYNKFIANEAHARHLSVGLKNDLDQVAELVDYFDFAVNEQCFEYNECHMLKPFTDQGKAILNAEYKAIWRDNEEARNDLCATANANGMSSLILPLYLDDSFRLSCL